MITRTCYMYRTKKIFTYFHGVVSNNDCHYILVHNKNITIIGS